MAAACLPYREALSAIADGEASPVAAADLRAHLDACARCTAFAAATESLDRRLRFTEAEPVPDLTARILAAIPTPDVERERVRLSQLRGVLALAGVAQFVVAVIVLVTADGIGVHTSREVGIFQLALGVGFLVVAARPARAAGLLPVAAVVALLVSVTSIGDVVVGASTALEETAHLLEVVGTGLLWALQRRTRPAAPPVPTTA